MPEQYVLDSFALMSFFQNEPGADRVGQLLENAVEGSATLSISAVNLGEVIYGLRIRRGVRAAAEALGAISDWPLSVIDADQQLCLHAASVKAETRLGYLDCFVVALGQQAGAAIVTGDPDFQRAEDLVRIEWLPQR